MGKFSRLGNDLYSGKRSVDFVGRTRLWFAISGVIIIAAVLGLYFKGLNYGIEFVGGAQYTVSVPSVRAMSTGPCGSWNSIRFANPGSASAPRAQM